jgi:ABC-type Fe3+-siderophore transport system permease subunit
MRSRDSTFVQAGQAMSRVQARNRRRLLLASAVVGVAVVMFAVTLQSLLAEAQERRASAAAELAHIKRPGGK